jgi:hypothetical protein
MTPLTSTPSTLIYLFADKIVDQVVTASWLRKCTRVPCRHAQVRTDKLACLLLASALWALREDGLIGLALATRKKWMFDRTQVEVIRLKQADRSGLEGLLVGRLVLESEDLDGVICRAFAESIVDPWDDVVQEAVRDAVASGYIEEVSDPNDVAENDPAEWQRGLRSKCQEIATLENEFARFHASWGRFRSSEPDLFEHLLHRCGNALLSCREKYFA